MKYGDGGVKFRGRKTWGECVSDRDMELPGLWPES